MHRCVSGVFYNLSYFMKHQHLLDPIDESHLYALHYVFLPRINRALNLFEECWNNHHRIYSVHVCVISLYCPCTHKTYADVVSNARTVYKLSH